jgi:hypothetical protein
VSTTSARTLVSIMTCQSRRSARCAGKRALREAGVVHQQVDAAEIRRQRIERGAHRGFVADVEDGGMHVVGAEFVDERLQAIRAAARWRRRASHRRRSGAWRPGRSRTSRR